jgi:5'-3' exoribonuclease 2
MLRFSLLYSQGVPSWNWYYPFHYAPFASDLINIDSYKIEFELSEPFRPVEQLLAVLPAESVGALPRACRALMVDPSSPIIDLYGSDAPIDPNGKHLPWLWILLLPFVDEKRIVSAFQQYKAGLTVEECRRNAFGVSIVFLHSNHKLAIEARSKMRYRPLKEVDPDVLHALAVANEDLGPEEYNDLDDSCNAAAPAGDESANTDTDAAPKEVQVPLQESIVFDPVLGDGISGTLSAPPQKWFALAGPGFTVTAPPTPPPAAFQNLVSNQVICLTFASPPEIPGSHKSELLPGVVLEKSNLTNFDLAARKPPRLNRGGFNIVDLALGLRRGPNTNNILRYEGNGNQRGGDGGGYHPNQQQYNHNNQGSNPQQFLQHFQQQQQQYGNNNGNHGYGYDIGNRGNNGRGGRHDGNDGRNGQQSGGNGWNRNNNNDDGRQYNQNQNQNQNHQQFRHQQPMNDNRSFNQHQQPYQHQRHQHQQQQQQQHGGQNYSHQQYPPQGYQQQQQYNGNFLTAQAYPPPSAPGKNNARFSFSSQGPSGPGPNGSSGSITPISMDSMRAQLAMTLQQQGGLGQGPQGQGPGPGSGPGSFSSMGQQGDRDRR